MKKETKVAAPKKRVVAKKSSSLAVEEKKLTFEGWKRKQIALKVKK